MFGIMNFGELIFADLFKTPFDPTVPEQEPDCNWEEIETTTCEWSKPDA